MKEFRFYRNFEEIQARKKKSKLFWGFILVLGGFLFLAKNFGVWGLELPPQFFTWRIIPFLFFINFIIIKRYFGAVVMLVISMFLFAPILLGTETWELKKKLLPVIPILIGILFLIKANKKKEPIRIKKCEPFTSSEELDKNELDSTLILSGGSKKINSYDFKGGRITTILAGLELDLTNCTLSQNKATIDVTAVMGGISINVPREWNVILDVVPVLGGVDDSIRKTPSAYVDPGAELVIRGTVVMGGVEINRI